MFGADGLAFGLISSLPSFHPIFTHLHHLEILEALLDENLNAAGVGLGLVFAEGVAGAAEGVLAEVVGRELLCLAEELAVLRKVSEVLMDELGRCGAVVEEKRLNVPGTGPAGPRRVRVQ